MITSRSFARWSVRLASVIGTSRRNVISTKFNSVTGCPFLQESTSTAAQIRFHSTPRSASSEEATQQESFADPQQRILMKAMNHVPEHGWTKEALAAGAMELGYPSVAHGMFTRGSIELVGYFMDTCLAKLRTTLIINTDKLQAMTVAERLKFGVRKRLEMLDPVINSWPQGMALGALPQNAPSIAKRLAQLSDEIWYFAGDKSTDYSWYTKRAILVGVYASTELFMLTDKSPNFQDTWAFLDRRVDETIQLGELPQNLKDVVGMAGIGLQSMFSAVTSLTGPLVGQVVSNTPLSHVSNPIVAMGSVVPPSVLSTIVSGLPFTAPTSAGSTVSGIDATTFQPKDMREINEELEKLGGVDTSEERS